MYINNICSDKHMVEHCISSQKKILLEICFIETYGNKVKTMIDKFCHVMHIHFNKYIQYQN